jgi:DNA repair protein RecN (Recombination protein N)
MIQVLRITDYVLFGRLDIEFGENLNVISGETGAGKSILLGALGLLLGGDVSGDLIRRGAEKAVVEGLFRLSETKRSRLSRMELIDEETGDELVIRREISSSGRSRGFVNGHLANIATLKKLGEELIEILGQQEHQLLVKPANQLAILDAYGRLERLRERFGSALARRKACEAELAGLEDHLARDRGEMELMRFQMEEIERADPQPGEDEKLEQERRLLENSEHIRQALGQLTSGLEGDDLGGGAVSGQSPEPVLDSLGSFRKTFEVLAGMTDRATEPLKQFDEARFLLEEVTASLRDLAGRVEHDPARLEEVRDRLDVLYKLKKKYGPSLPEVFSFTDKLAGRLSKTERGESELDELRSRLEDLSTELVKAAGELTAGRKAAASRLEKEICRRLTGLAMGRGEFKVEFDTAGSGGQDDPGYLTTGADRVTFLLTTNPGIPLMPLSKVASGGELSRVMLAIRSALAAVEAPSTMLFDEVDSGIGGKVGRMVGSYLSEVAQSHQVLVVTHLAQLARNADTHLVVEKSTRGDKTETVVRTLSNEERPAEIARMLGGDADSELSLAHARQMLENSEKEKD